VSLGGKKRQRGSSEFLSRLRLMMPLIADFFKVAAASLGLLELHAQNSRRRLFKNTLCNKNLAALYA
jgi:hypothetical protein